MDEFVAVILAFGIFLSTWVAGEAAKDAIELWQEPTIASLDCAEDEVIDWITPDTRGCVHIEEID